jgi:hypothetical protein
MISVLDLAETQLAPSNATHITIYVKIDRLGTGPSHGSFGIASFRKACRQRPARRVRDVLVPKTDLVHVLVGKQLVSAPHDLHGSPTRCDWTGKRVFTILRQVGHLELDVS